MPQTTKGPRKATKKPVQAMVVIAPRLQLVFVILLTLTWMASCVPFAYSLIHLRNVTVPYWWVQAFYMLFPVLLFAIGYVYVGKLGTMLARMCKAALLALAGCCVLICLQLTIGFAFPLIRNFEGPLGPYDTLQTGVYTLTLVLYAFTLGYLKLQRGKRG